MTDLLKTIQSPDDLKGLSMDQLKQVARELREFIVDSVSQTGGHFASNLGTVELTVALHRIFDSPRDKIIWDVGHQAYPHKILTGRQDRFPTLRQYQGLSGFLRLQESPHDVFGAGHSSTSISAALGYALARDHRKEDYKCIAVIGDGALTAGMAFEALNHAGDLKRDLIIVLNDNKMSISPNVGAISAYLNSIITGDFYNLWKNRIDEVMNRIPKYGSHLRSLVNRFEEGLKSVIVPGVLFEEMGIRYFGPIDGHNLDHLIDVFEKTKNLNTPRLIHVITTKGKGYKKAEKDPLSWHGPPKAQFVEEEEKPPLKAAVSAPSAPSYTDVFEGLICELAQEDPRIVAITAAMCTGTGLVRFAEEFPERFYDVGIAEQHAVTMAAGMALGGLRPVVTIYSTFLQRAFDQILHDVCIQNLPVIFAMDRAGIVGADGATHQGLYDISYLRPLPNMILMAPSDELEMHRMFRTALTLNRPCAIRYPRGKAQGLTLGPERKDSIELGKARAIQDGSEIAILSYGTILDDVRKALPLLERESVRPFVADMRFGKPLDHDLILSLAERDFKIVTIEENALAGGFGGGVLEILEEARGETGPVLRLGIPDRFIEHGERPAIMAELDLSPEKIAERIVRFAHQAHPGRTFVSPVE